MKLLNRNLKPFSYCLFTGIESVFDEYGNETGTKVIYGNAITIKGNVSASQGQSEIQLFGNSEQYSKVILVDNINCPIDENSVLFVDKEPEFDEKQNPLFDYVVKQVATYLNVKAYAIDKVKVSGFYG